MNSTVRGSVVFATAVLVAAVGVGEEPSAAVEVSFS